MTAITRGDGVKEGEEWEESAPTRLIHTDTGNSTPYEVTASIYGNVENSRNIREYNKVKE